MAFGTTAWAQNNYIECSWDAENKTVVQNLRAIPYGTTSVTSSTTTLSGWHEISGNVTINGNVICEGDARLILHDNAHLTIKGGLSVNKTNTNNSLTIYCQSYGDSMGKLTVTCDTELCNGIGGNLINSQRMPHGTITIHGGDIYTKGGPCAVGLGSIRSGSSPITIFGGRVEAHAGEVVSSGVNELACSGIGIIGNGGSGASLIVYGGDVYAYGASDAAGIGGCDGKPKYLAGSDSDGGIINIYGGYVEAYGGDYGAGIGGGQNGNGGSITIADGGQLIHPQDVQATLEKQVTGYTANDNGWYNIASPVTGDYSTEGFVTDDNDLYCYHEPTHYWWNAKGDAQDDHSFNTLANGQGYLYANGTDKTLAFPGVMQGTGNTVTLPLSYTEDAGNLKGFNLLGNPFTRSLTSSDVIKIGGTDLTTYYTVENGGDLEVRNLDETPIKPGQGFMVQATEANQELVINYVTRGEQAKAQPAYLCIEAGNDAFMDRAYLQIGSGNTLRKMTLKDNTAQLSLQHEGSDWAATTIEMATGEMPVSFKATENGTYTLTVSGVFRFTSHSVGEPFGVPFSVLRLIDNLTGTDIDLLATPSYTFEAKTTDNASRFKLVVR